MKRLTWIGWVLAFVAVVVSAGRAAAQTGLEGDPESGAIIYAANCAVCHGLDARGRIGPNLSDAFSGIDVDAYVERTIASGVSGSPMPTWSQAEGGPLSEQEIADVAAYVIGLAGGTEPIAPAPTLPALPVIDPLPGVPGDPNAGQEIFLQNCAVCHGDKGQGRIGVTLAKAWPGIIPEAYVRSVVESGVSGSPMPAWGQANGGPLSEGEITDVSAFIVSLQKSGASTAPVDEVQSGPLSAGTGLLFLGAIVVGLVVVGVVYYRRSPG